MIITFINNCTFIDIEVAIMNDVPPSSDGLAEMLGNSTKPLCTQCVPSPSKEGGELDSLLNKCLDLKGTVANLVGTQSSPHTQGMIMSDVPNKEVGSTLSALPPSDESEYLKIQRDVEAIVAELKETLPPHPIYKDVDTMIKYVNHVMEKLKPLFSKVLLQMHYIQSHKSKDKRREWKYEWFTYPRSFFYIVAKWQDEWYELIRNWKTGDDVLGEVFKMIFSGRRPRELIRRICPDGQYTAKVFRCLSKHKYTRDEIDEPQTSFYLTAYLPDPVIVPPPSNTIYMPREKVNEYLRDVQHSGGGAMESNDLFSGGGIIDEHRLFGGGDFMKKFGDGIGLVKVVSRDFSMWRCVPKHQKDDYHLLPTTSMEVWTKIPPKEQCEVFQSWASEKSWNQTKRKLAELISKALREKYIA